MLASSRAQRCAKLLRNAHRFTRAPARPCVVGRKGRLAGSTLHQEAGGCGLRFVPRIPAALFDEIVPLLDLEPLQGALADVRVTLDPGPRGAGRGAELR